MHKACVQEPEAVDVVPGIVQLPGVQHRHDTVCCGIVKERLYALLGIII